MVDAPDLVSLASDAAFAVDENLRIVGWNGGAHELLGYAAGEVTGRRCYDILQAVLPSGEPLCTPMCEGARCLKHGRPYAVPSCRLCRKDGRWISATISTLVMPREVGVRPAGATVAIVFLREYHAEPSRPLFSQPLRIFTLGHFGLAVGAHGLAVDKWKRKQALTLLKYLVVHQGRPVHRECLSECLWPEADEAHGWERLKVTVYFLRRQLRAAGMCEDVVQTVGRSYMLRRDAVWVDADAFEGLVSEGEALERQQRSDEALHCYEDAQRLYRGDYLEEDLYADWCAEERQRLRERYLDTLAGMAECYAACGRPAEAARVCRTALSCDPCRESFLRALLENLVGLGRPDWAEAEFRHWQRVLVEELGVELMPETLRLHWQLLNPMAGAGDDRRVAAGRAM